jgi:hypothetical protein
MQPNRLIVGWSLGLLMVSIGGAQAKSSGTGPTEFSPAAEFPSWESAVVPESPPIPPLPVATKIAQNTSDQNKTRTNIPNAANVSVQMSPDQPVNVGTKISFRVTTKKPGYLLLVDIDANGKMSQIFPSPEMIVQSQEAAINFIKPGGELLIPNSAAKKRGFEYVITPPTGQATVVAIFSERRVQILDLPDDAPVLRTEAETISYLTGWTSELRIPDPGTGVLQPSNWSFDIKHYSIR